MNWSEISVQVCWWMRCFFFSVTTEILCSAHSNFCPNEITFKVHKRSFTDLKCCFIWAEIWMSRAQNFKCIQTKEFTQQTCTEPNSGHERSLHCINFKWQIKVSWGNVKVPRDSIELRAIVALQQIVRGYLLAQLCNLLAQLCNLLAQLCNLLHNL